MRVTEHEQRSEGWYAARLGIPTASQFGKIITPTGKKSAQMAAYCNQLIAEKITGEPTYVKVTDAMQHGTDTEPEARAFYEIAYDVEVFEVGLCLHDTLDAGASPDGLVGDDGLLEIKCPQPGTMVEYLREEWLPAKYKPQVQGQLWITGREWCDFFAYHPTMKPLMVRTYRDEEYIGELAALVGQAVDIINANVEKLRRK